MIPEDSDYGSRSGPALPAGVNPHAADPERRAFLQKVGKGAKYVAPTLTVLTLSRKSLADDFPPPPSDFPNGHPYNPYNPDSPLNSKGAKRG